MGTFFRDLKQELRTAPYGWALNLGLQFSLSTHGTDRVLQGLIGWETDHPEHPLRATFIYAAVFFVVLLASPEKRKEPPRWSPTGHALCGALWAALLAIGAERCLAGVLGLDAPFEHVPLASTTGYAVVFFFVFRIWPEANPLPTCWGPEPRREAAQASS